jgi:DNA-binding IclR family transcriptional regulator
MTEAELQTYLKQTELVSFNPHTIIDRNVLEEDLLRSRERGYSISRQEILIHQIGIGAPLFEAGGGVVGAISMRLKVKDVDTKFMTTAANDLIQTAFQISLELGYQPMEMKASQA